MDYNKMLATRIYLSLSFATKFSRLRNWHWISVNVFFALDFPIRFFTQTRSLYLCVFSRGFSGVCMRMSFCCCFEFGAFLFCIATSMWTLWTSTNKTHMLRNLIVYFWLHGKTTFPKKKTETVAPKWKGQIEGACDMKIVKEISVILWKCMEYYREFSRIIAMFP